MQQAIYHKPVLTREVIEYLAPKPGGIYVDATFGGGGHTRAILEANPECTVVSVDWDKTALDTNAAALEEEFRDRFKTIWGNFSQLPELLKKNKIGKIDGVLADFGTSQYQIEHQAGFSFSRDTELDMRMSPAHQLNTAYEIVNFASEVELAHILFEYGEEVKSRKIARAIVEARKKKRIKTTKELADIVLTVIPRHPRARIHPATKTFQALRIVINKELDNIRAFLKHAPLILKPGGRLVTISFHSLEDRLVKQYIRDNSELFVNLTPKGLSAQEDELKANPSSRSARLRAAELK